MYRWFVSVCYNHRTCYLYNLRYCSPVQMELCLWNSRWSWNDFVKGMVDHFMVFFCIFVSQRNDCLHTFYVDCVLTLVVTAENDKYCRCGICEVAEKSSQRLGYFLYFLVWRLLPTRCRCRRLLLHLSTLSDTHSYTLSDTQTHCDTHTHTRWHAYIQWHTLSDTHATQWQTHSVTHTVTHT